MSTPFQNRLVGSIIVAAAVIIFLPDLLDGKKKSHQAEFDAIPKAPTFTGEVSQKPFPTDKLVLKESPVISNEKAQDELLLKTREPPKKILKEKIEDKTASTNHQKAKVTPAAQPKKIIEDNTSTTKQAIIEKPELGSQPTKALNKEAWVIQLGSFKHKSNVDELIEKLKQNGYRVFTQPIQTKQGMLTKVFVGPELIKKNLVKKLPALKKLTNVQGKIARFYPTK